MLTRPILKIHGGTIRARLFLVNVFVCAILLIGCGPSTPVATIDKSPQMQEKRADLIEELTRLQVFAKIESPGSVPRVWVRPAFYLLDFDQKQNFVSVVYAYHFDGSSAGDFVRVIDNQTGKEIGQFNPRLGGLKLN